MVTQTLHVIGLNGVTVLKLRGKAQRAAEASCLRKQKGTCRGRGASSAPRSINNNNGSVRVSVCKIRRSKAALLNERITKGGNVIVTITKVVGNPLLKRSKQTLKLCLV